MKRKTLFLDRDGIILEMIYDAELGRVFTALHPDQMKFNFGIFDLLKSATEKDYQLIIVTNQPNVGLGRTTEENFDKVTELMIREIEKYGVKIVEQYFCPHHPHAIVEKYRMDCDCRKPKPGMILKAIEDHDVDTEKSFMIGDGVNDIIAGHAAGVRTILVGNLVEAEYLHKVEEHLNGIKPDFIVKKVTEAIDIL